MSAQHTPGPWTVGEMYDYSDGSNLPPEIGLCVNGSRWSKIVNSVTVSEPDARLIAAAPDLYRELVELVDWIVANQRSMEGEFLTEELLEAPRAALAKVSAA